MKALGIAVIGGLIGLTGCGGGGSSSEESSETPSQPETQTGVFLDSPVANINYRTETLGDVTNANGEYEYSEGETVTFSIGDLEFPPVPAKAIVTPLDLAATQDTSDSTVINIIRLLQSLDEDGNPENGITITETAKNTATQVNFSLPESDFESSSATVNLVANSGSTNVALVSTNDAVAHFEKTLSDTPLTSRADIEIPKKQISIDGNNTDWSGVQPIGLDPTGDQNGNSSTDLVKVSIAKSGETIALLLETAGNIQLYHTPGSDASHYEIGFRFYTDSKCDGDDKGFFIVNNFTFSNGDNTHVISGIGNITGDEGQQTNTAHAGNFLETSFSSSILSVNEELYFSLNPYVQSFSPERISTLHDKLKSDICFRWPVQ